MLSHMIEQGPSAPQVADINTQNNFCPSSPDAHRERRLALRGSKLPSRTESIEELNLHEHFVDRECTLRRERLEQAKSLLANTAESVTTRTVSNRTDIANDGGATPLQKMDACLSQVTELQSQIEDLHSKNDGIHTRLESIEKLGLHEHFIIEKEPGKGFNA